jgi:biopolymer transport protein ExbD
MMLAKAETAKDLGAKTGSEDFEFKGEVLLQVDKRMPFSVVREVMFTAGQAQFGNFRFVVIKGSG